MLPLFRAVLVWVVVLVAILLPRLDTPATRPVTVAVTQLSAFDRASVVQQTRTQRAQAQQMTQVQSWSDELKQGLADYQARQQAQADAQAAADRVAALSNHPGPPPDIAKDIYDAFQPLGDRAVQWAVNVAYCESRYHPNSVNSSSGASGLFQFLPSTWAFTPYAGYSPFDPKYNSLAAAWLYQRDGPSQWQCQG
ncbi:MAG TPA: transglycosylase SLT domain-containing protein [Candidatus Dormibacteraeota bacterium]|nr:transglycosylase SLT domain-containing protein [Candidatus Dormibacteraeota bacterium]